MKNSLQRTLIRVTLMKLFPQPNIDIAPVNDEITLKGLLTLMQVILINCLPFHLSQSLCTFISAGSKFAQLQCLWQSKDSGQVSALSWGMATYTCFGE